MPYEYSSGSHEHWDKPVLEMETHDDISAADELLAYVDGGDRWPAPQLRQRRLDLAAVLELIQLINGEICPEVPHQRLYRVGHGAAAPAEHHQRPPLHHARYVIHIYLYTYIYCNRLYFT